MDCKDINKGFQNLYFVGAGGIGMSALVRYYLHQGCWVAGYDRTETALTRQLNDEGAAIHYEDDPDRIGEAFRKPEDTLVVYTPAVPDDHRELAWFRRQGHRIVKRSELLGLVTRSREAICVAGTHGKTTVTSMIAHLLKRSSRDCSAFLGGILKGYDSNLMLSESSRLVVVEADEYDRSFHQLQPSMAVITSVAPDHLDIYGSEEAYREAFVHFASLIKPGGALLMEQGVDLRISNKDIHIYRYGIDETQPADFRARNIRVEDGEIRFDFIAPKTLIENVLLGAPARINVVNAVGAMGIGWICGLSETELWEGISTFPGPRRRFDFHIKTRDRVVIDDYAHHPEELLASIESVRELFPGRRLTVVFQPHLYSRTRDFYREFAASLSLADEVILLPIYPAREEPLAGVSSELILDEIEIADRRSMTKEELVAEIGNINPDVLLIAGAGDIELLVKPVVEELRTKN